MISLDPYILLLEVPEEPRGLLTGTVTAVGGRAASVGPCTEQVAVVAAGRWCSVWVGEGERGGWSGGITGLGTEGR